MNIKKLKELYPNLADRADDDITKEVFKKFFSTVGVSWSDFKAIWGDPVIEEKERVVYTPADDTKLIKAISDLTRTIGSAARTISDAHDRHTKMMAQMMAQMEKTVVVNPPDVNVTVPDKEKTAPPAYDFNVENKGGGEYLIVATPRGDN